MFDIWHFILLYVCLSLLCGTKQYKALEKYSNDDEFAKILFTFAILLSPIWIIGAFVRQVLIEDWK